MKNFLIGLISCPVECLRFVSLPFDDGCTEIYGGVRTNLERAGTPIRPYDLQIASIAIANNLILVTHNVDEFQRITELKIEDWEAI